MTINWLIFKNETCVALRRSTRLVQICMFFDYLLMAFAETPLSGNMSPTQPVTSFFQPVEIKQSKRLKLWNVMHNDVKLTWGRSY